MTIAPYMPLIVAALVGLSGPALTRRLRPSAAAVTLTVVAVLAAATALWSLGLVAFTAVARVPVVAGRVGWKAEGLRALQEVPQLVATFVLLVVIVAVGHALATMWRVGRTTWMARSACAPDGIGVDVVASPTPLAQAIPGHVVGQRRHATVLVSTGMLELLDPTERRAVLAHERAHLRHRHHLYLAVSRICAATVPFLRPVECAVRHSLERWADEEAAVEVGDRRATARALATSALAGLGVPTTSLAFAEIGVAARVEALIHPEPPMRGARIGYAIAFVASLIAVVASVEATRDLERLMELVLHYR